MYALVNERLDAVAVGLDELERTGEAPNLAPGPDGRDVPAYDARVLRDFVADGRLRLIPAQEKKRLVVLRWLLERCFPDDRAYPEPEVNERIGAVHPDTAALRRHLVEHRLMTRSGGVYRRA